MTREEIDTMWQQALHDSVKDGEMFTRYHFAKMVAAKEQERIAGLLKGIECTDSDDENGWWETSSGAKFGAEILRKIKGAA